MSTLMESGYTADELGSDNMNKLADYLEAQLEAQKGVVGFGTFSNRALTERID